MSKENDGRGVKSEEENCLTLERLEGNLCNQLIITSKYFNLSFPCRH